MAHCLLSVNSTAAVAVAVLAVVTAYGESLPTSRVPDWFTYPPGVQGGIPNRTTIFTNLAVDNTGATDISTALNAAIAACPSNQVVYLPAGTYLMTTSVVMKSGITLRGAGMTNTMLVYSNGTGASALYWPRWSTMDIYYANNRPAHSNDVFSGSTRGSTNIALAPGPYLSNYTAGRFLLIDQTNDPAIFGGSLEGYSYMGRCDGARMHRQIVEVLTVANGTNLTFTPPLVWDYTNWPQVVYLPQVDRWAGVEDLCITNAWATYPGGSTLDFRQTVDCWAKNVAVRRCAYAGFFAYHAFRCTVQGCDFRENYTYYTPNRSYAVLLANATSDCLVQDNIVHHSRAGLLAAACGARNVFAYNYAHQGWNEGAGMLASFTSNHGGNPWFTLWEGNVGTGFVSDLFHGGSSYNILFRNWAKGWDPGGCTTSTNSYQRAIVLCTSNLYYSVVGNVLGDPALANPNYATWTYAATTNDISNEKPYIWRLGFVGTGESTDSFDTRVLATTFRHGNFDFTNNAVADWQGGYDATLPASLYLAAKPAWFGSLAWPAIGPDVPRLTNRIPAQARFLGEAAAPAAPVRNIQTLRADNLIQR